MLWKLVEMGFKFLRKNEINKGKIFMELQFWGWVITYKLIIDPPITRNLGELSFGSRFLNTDF